MPYHRSNSRYQPPQYPRRYPYGRKPAYGHYHSRYTYRPPFNNQPPERSKRERSTSPIYGSEEYIRRKVQKTSDLIKKQLSGDCILVESPPPQQPERTNTDNSVGTSTTHEESSNPREVISKNETSPRKKLRADVDNIHDKIVTHITNLKHGRKIKLISSNSSSYDTVFENIQKQQRLELSKFLREMCSKNKAKDRNNIMECILPDYGIKIGDLPIEIIEQIEESMSIDLTDDVTGDELPVKVKEEHLDEMEASIQVKSEPNEPNDEPFNFPAIKQEITNDLIGEIEAIPFNTQTASTQTDNEDRFEKMVNNCANYEDAIGVMLNIDKEIARLTRLRQNLFKNKRKMQPKVVYRKHKKNSKQFAREIQFDSVESNVLCLRLLNEYLLAATESGHIVIIDRTSGKTQKTVRVSQSAITSLVLYQKSVLVGSLDHYVYEYGIKSHNFVKSVDISDGVQCMTSQWNLLFVGTMTGRLVRYSLLQNQIEFDDKLAESSILVMKATQEGARKVLIVGLRSSPIYVWDAMSGLHMRTMVDQVNMPTVYCLLIEKSLVYCGTMANDVLIYNFYDGELLKKYEGANAKGIACIKIVHNLLFAGCFDGNVYVYNTSSHEFVGSISGNGHVILSMEIVENLIILGTMSCHLVSVLIPPNFLSSNK